MNELVKFLTAIRVIETMTGAFKIGRFAKLSEYQKNQVCGLVYDDSVTDPDWNEVASNTPHPVVMFLHEDSNKPEYYEQNTGLKVLYVEPTENSEASIIIELSSLHDAATTAWVEITADGWSIENASDKPIWLNALPCYLPANPDDQTERFYINPGYTVI